MHLTIYNVTQQKRGKNGAAELASRISERVLHIIETKERYREFLGKNDGAIYEVFAGVDDLVCLPLAFFRLKSC